MLNDLSAALPAVPAISSIASCNVVAVNPDVELEYVAPAALFVIAVVITPVPVADKLLKSLFAALPAVVLISLIAPTKELFVVVVNVDKSPSAANAR